MSAEEKQVRRTSRRDFLCLGAGLVVGGAAAYMFTPKPEPTTFSGRGKTKVKITVLKTPGVVDA